MQIQIECGSPQCPGRVMVVIESTHEQGSKDKTQEAHLINTYCMSPASRGTVHCKEVCMAS
eukprot:5291314-Pleurochrysis_carterae.AAC.1